MVGEDVGILALDQVEEQRLREDESECHHEFCVCLRSANPMMRTISMQYSRVVLSYCLRGMPLISVVSPSSLRATSLFCTANSICSMIFCA
jgi:hypothetical protein